ncbi:MAG: DUF3179 domain-containing protein [Deltaproteobacteria bacterium]|jgi:hypothetical protein|nr:DUF3179 domain-containing protein [Deltaproteobacteria bacterium]
MFHKTFFVYMFIMVLALSAAIGSLAGAFSKVIHDGDSTYIVDRHGERWDVTQARSIGFMPERFQHGIGRNAFTPLDDSSLKDHSPTVSKSLRVIGISDGKEARAYSVPRLYRHEVANSSIGDKQIAAAY